MVRGTYFLLSVTCDCGISFKKIPRPASFFFFGYLNTLLFDEKNDTAMGENLADSTIYQGCMNYNNITIIITKKYIAEREIPCNTSLSHERKRIYFMSPARLYESKSGINVLVVMVNIYPK